MGNLTIRNLDDDVIKALKMQAKTNQRSLEAEVRYVLTQRANRRSRLADFRERTRQIAGMTSGAVQTDSVELLREDRNRFCHCDFCLFLEKQGGLYGLILSLILCHELFKKIHHIRAMQPVPVVADI